MSALLSGAIVMACATIGLHFLRFWKSSRDRFFLYFALAFWIMGAQWLHASLAGMGDDYDPINYVARLLAYVLIVCAIVGKNARQRS